jgi:LysR family transcriptional activator of glutamate synthase operon
MADGDYEWFVTLAELQHVTAAAEQVGIAQPTLTRMLARLERRLGVALFDRAACRIEL